MDISKTINTKEFSDEFRVLTYQNYYFYHPKQYEELYDALDDDDEKDNETVYKLTKKGSMEKNAHNTN